MENPWTSFMTGDTDPAGESISDVESILDLLSELEIGGMLFRQALTARLGISATEHLVLDLLIRHGGLAGSQLGGMTGLSSAAISELADRLQETGLLTRAPDPRDGWVTVELLQGLRDADLDAVTIFLSRATDRAFRQARSLRFSQREPSRWRSRGSTSRPAPPRSAPE